MQSFCGNTVPRNIVHYLSLICLMCHQHQKLFPRHSSIAILFIYLFYFLSCLHTSPPLFLLMMITLRSMKWIGLDRNVKPSLWSQHRRFGGIPKLQYLKEKNYFSPMLRAIVGHQARGINSETWATRAMFFYILPLQKMWACGLSYQILVKW